MADKVDKLVDDFNDTARRAVSREAGKPGVYAPCNGPQDYKIIWGSDYSPIKHGSRMNIYIIQGRKEFTGLLRTIESLKNRSVGLETGFFKGGTHLLFREFFDKFISVEINPLPFLVYLQNNVFDGRSEFVIGHSYSNPVLNTVKELSHGTLDFVFIDGDHSYMGVKLDFLSYWPLIRDNGIVAIHDAKNTDFPGIVRFLNELRQIGFHMELIYIDLTGIAVIRKDNENKNNTLPRNEYLTSLDTLPLNARLCLYGSGTFGHNVKSIIESKRKDVIILYFIDTFKDGWQDGLRVLNVNDLKDHTQEFDLVLITSVYSEEIEEVLKKNGINDYKVAIPYLYN